MASARCEGADHVVVFSAAGLQRLIELYCTYEERGLTCR